MLKNFLKSLGNLILDTIEVLVMALALFAVAYLFLFQPHQINGNSMFPNFRDKEMLITEKVSFYLRKPQRGEIIVFKYPKAHEYDYIKRVVGLPGETIQIKNRKVFIYNDEHPQGVALEEPYLYNPETEGGTFLKEGEKFQIPEGEYFLMGDNRARSSDSRDWGTVQEGEIVGKAWFRYWPPQTFAVIDQPQY
ncbi:MAG: signal peptidase I [Patescibacteria group bacterium]|nr:signal peptidase I [Patescibacteria group bacterium]